MRLPLFFIPLAGTHGVHEWPPQEGLSWAAHGTSHREELLAGDVASSPFAVWDLGCDSAAIGLGQTLLGMGLLAGSRTVLVRTTIPISTGGAAASACPATCRGIFLSQ